MRSRYDTFAIILGALFAGMAVLGPGDLPAGETQRDSASRAAQEILATAGVQGGLIVHLGAGDGRLTAALRANDRYTVHGLEADPVKVAAAREHIAGLGLYGPVSVEQRSGSVLPYADNLLNLIVVEDTAAVSRDELLRVLAPLGVACLRTGGGWEKITKPRPASIDEWSHFLHDAGNNAVARDTTVGPPRSLQWVAPPLWLRSHETPSGIQAMVSAGGRMCYFFDEGVIGITDQRLPERWSLICRDAFNGKLLWKRTVEPWGWTQWATDKFGDTDWTTITGGRTVVPEENQRRLVADGNRLYATLSYHGPLTILDAATGEVQATVKGTEPVAEILASNGTVLVHSREPLVKGAKRKAKPEGKPSTFVAVRGDSGKVLWRREAKPIASDMLAVAAGRVVYLGGTQLTCLSLATGEPLWEVKSAKQAGQTLVADSGVVLLYSQSTLEAWDAASGKELWQHDVPASHGENQDLFVIDGLVWRGMVGIDSHGEPASKMADGMAVAYDLRTGEEKKRVVARELRSPEHHHRCYRNKATGRYIIGAMEGAEFMDLSGASHSQDNFLRGACRLGVMPCNGMLYAPADQCFCEPGAKLLGFAAVGPAASPDPGARPLSDADRLQCGPAYPEALRHKGTEALSGGQAVGASDSQSPISNPSDWPTYRHDPARHGSSSSAVPAQLVTAWRAKVGGRLSAPVAAGDRAYVAACDAHTVHALDLVTGKPLWKYVAGARIDSPPTVYQGLVLFGSADGRVYCVRASDGALVWRFLAAPADRRIGYFDQIESAWPVHGSVLVREGVAYATAGRSTYLDGGIRVLALDPYSGKVLHRTTLSGPFPDAKTGRDVGFYLRGANSDVLAAEGDAIYMRQKKFTPDLQPLESPILSVKGEQDVGLHVFSTSGLLDNSGYNRIFWMYAKRWPGFQLANQAPKSGQLLIVDDQNTYAVNAYYRRNVHSPMFFPGKEGNLLFSDANGNEPQIVGDAGARPPVAWLPQSNIPRAGNPGLDTPSFGLDKMIGYTRAEPPRWTRWVAIRIQAMVKAGDVLFVAGPPDVLDPADPYAAFEGRKGARLAAVAARDGAPLAEQALDAPPVFDGLIAARGRLLVSLEDGSLACLAGAGSAP